MDNHFTLPDGRTPIRFDKGNAAFYPRVKGEGEVRYTFTVIRYMQKNRPVKTKEELSRIAKERAAKIKKANPNHYSDIGSLGGSRSKRSKQDERSI